MDNPKIKIESNGVVTEVYLDGKKIRCTSINFHGDVDNGLRIKWDGTFLKEDVNGVVYTLNDESVTEEFHYDSNKAVSNATTKNKPNTNEICFADWRNTGI